MKPRERLLAAMRRQQPDRVPCELYMTPALLEHFREETGASDPAEYWGFEERIVAFRRPALAADYRRYYAGGLPEDATVDEWGVARQAGSLFHFTRMTHPLASAQTPEAIADYPLPDFRQEECWEHLPGQIAALHGRDLVDACYSTLLGRGPDPDGLSHSLQSLARGEEKAFVVGRIAYSAEGRQRGVAVGGLRLRYLIAAAKKVPIAGTLFAWIAALLGVHRQQRHQRAFEHHVATRLEALVAYTAQSNEQVALRIDALRAVLEARD